MQTQYFTRAEGSIAYDDSGGDGELVTLWPGIGDVRAEYRFLAPALAGAGYRVVSADLRGHGESSANWPEYTVTAAAEDMLGLIDHLDAGPAHLIGTSFSPGAAVIAAAERPDAVRSLTLIGAFVRDAPPSFVVNAFRAVGLRGPWKVAAWAWFYASLYPTRKPEDFDAYVSALKANLDEPGRFDALMGLAFCSRRETEQRLNQVQAPALVIMGTKDPDWPDPVAEARFIVDALEGELLLVEGAGHYPHAEMPEQVTPAVLAFLRKAGVA